MTKQAPHVAKQKGFTLFETLVYIALLTILIGGMIVAVYPIFASTERLSEKVTRDMEAGFFLQKLSWVLSAVSSVSLPTSGGTGSTLRVVTRSGDTLTIAQNGTNVSYKKNSGATMDLLSSRIDVTNLTFQNIAPAGGAPRVITISFDIDGEHVGPIYHNVY